METSKGDAYRVKKNLWPFFFLLRFPRRCPTEVYNCFYFLLFLLFFLSPAILFFENTSTNEDIRQINRCGGRMSWLLFIPCVLTYDISKLKEKCEMWLTYRFLCVQLFLLYRVREIPRYEKQTLKYEYFIHFAGYVKENMFIFFNLSKKVRIIYKDCK